MSPESTAAPRPGPNSVVIRSRPVHDPRVPWPTRPRRADDVGVNAAIQRRRRPLAVALAAGLICAAGPQSPAGLQPVQPDRDEPVVPVTPGTPRGLDPDAVSGPDGGPVLEDLSIPLGIRLPEGTFLSRRAGTLIDAPTGESIFVFDPPAPQDMGADDPAAVQPGAPAPATALPPMVLLPAQARGRMESMAFGATSQRRFRVSGEVTAYRGRNYLLPTSFSVVTAQVQSATNPNKGAEQAPVDQSALARDPSVDALIRDLVERREVARGLASPSAGVEAGGQRGGSRGESNAGGRGTVARTVGGLAEGTLLGRTRGRLMRFPGGELAFTTDSGLDSGLGDAAEAAADDPTAQPLLLLPAVVTQRLEFLSASRGDSVAIQVSGRVYSYAGRRYLRPIMFVIEPNTDITPMQ